LLILIPVAIRLALASGISWDEEKQLEYGKRLLAWYTSRFKDRDSFSYMDLYLYGGLFDLPAQLLLSSHLSPWGAYETRHVLSALLAIVGIVAVWMTANRIAGPRAAFLAGAVLALTPAWVGHGLFNSKDIPFATAAAFVAYATTRIAMRPALPTWGDAWRTGVSVGCALGIRSGGMFLFAFPALASLLRLILYWQARARRGELVHIARDSLRTVGKLSCAVPVAWALMLVAWPWAQVAPIRRPLQAAAIARHFVWGGSMLFDGRTITTDDIPRSYLPIWFKVTLPDFYLLALVCAVIALALLLRKRTFSTPHTLAIAMLIVFIVAPYLGVVVTRPVIYDAHRHFLFLVPAMAVLAGLALDGLLTTKSLPKLLRGMVVALLVGLGAVTVYDMRLLHPYEYIYFNRLSGGLRRQATRFETDYWGLSYREGFDWVVHNLEPGSSRRIHISACYINGPLVYYREQWKADRFVVEGAAELAEVLLVMRRSECQAAAGAVLHAVERLGVPLSVVRRRELKGSYADTCRRCRSTARYLRCECQNSSGAWVRSRVKLPCNSVSNNNGRLVCNNN
jgi:hypothetical protein